VTTHDDAAPAPGATEPDPRVEPAVEARRVPEAPGTAPPADPARAPLGAAEIAALAAPSTTRRAPRYGRFAFAGVLVGALVSALAAILGPQPEGLGRGTIFLLVFLALGSLGALTGVLLAIAADRRSLRRRP
jgi:hypothetical protein